MGLGITVQGNTRTSGPAGGSLRQTHPHVTLTYGALFNVSMKSEGSPSLEKDSVKSHTLLHDNGIPVKNQLGYLTNQLAIYFFALRMDARASSMPCLDGVPRAIVVMNSLTRAIESAEGLMYFLNAVESAVQPP